MKNRLSGILDGIQNILEDKGYASLRTLCFQALLLCFLECLVLAVVHQSTGQIPYVKRLSLIFWSWQLPFGISRLWDFTLLLPFAFFSYKIFCAMEDEECEMSNFSGEHSGVLDVAMFSLLAAFLGGLIFGAIYAIPIYALAFVGIPLLWVIFCLGFLLARSFWKLSNRNRGASPS